MSSASLATTCTRHRRRELEILLAAHHPETWGWKLAFAEQTLRRRRGLGAPSGGQGEASGTGGGQGQVDPDLEARVFHQSVPADPSHSVVPIDVDKGGRPDGLAAGIPHRAGLGRQARPRADVHPGPGRGSAVPAATARRARPGHGLRRRAQPLRGDARPRVQDGAGQHGPSLGSVSASARARQRGAGQASKPTVGSRRPPTIPTPACFARRSALRSDARRACMTSCEPAAA